MIKLNTLKDVDLENKRILLRLDLDVPLENGQIVDDSRLVASLDTLNLLFKNFGNVIIAGHLGRPSGFDQKLSLAPIASWFAEKFQGELTKGRLGEFDGWKIKENLFILENLRFYKGEEENDPAFSQTLASLADIYINDAFAVSHRAHSSVVGVTKFLPHYAGLRLEKEVSVLSAVLENPKRPLIIVIGGAKIETKLPLVKKMNSFADTLLVGGKIAMELKDVLSNKQDQLGEGKSKLLIADSDDTGKDITQKSAADFSEAMENGATIVWNGLMGVVEEGFEDGTKIVAQGIINSSAYSVVGGGDTIGYLAKIGIFDKFSFVSMGGGAMLEFLAGDSLPGLEALT